MLIDIPEIEASAVRAWLEEGKDFLLLDVLPDDAHEEFRIPNSRNAAVYEVVFTEKVEQMEPNRDRPVVVYCSGPDSRASADAAEKLRKAGYREIHRLTGGRLAWQEKGYPVEGRQADRPWQPRLPREYSDGTHEIDTGASVLEWVGRNDRNRHFGTVGIVDGAIVVREGAVAGGRIVIDMTKIAVLDLDDTMAPVLIAHLESDDFFSVSDHPMARGEILSAAPIRDATPGRPNLHMQARLHLLGNHADFEFDAIAVPGEDGGVVLEAHFDIDRTRWDVNYGSGGLYARLGKHLVNDHVSVAARIRTH